MLCTRVAFSASGSFADETLSFWMSLWFRLAVLAGGVAMLGGLHALRLRHIRRENIRLETEVAARTEELRYLAVTDELTGVANRRYFYEVYEKEFQRAVREKTFLSVIMLDVDDFESFNDTFGHTAGDECLRKVAGRLSRCAKRSGDVIARYGGEEFVMLLPNTPIAGCMKIAEGLRLAVKELDIHHPAATNGSRVTVSAGVASLIPRRDTPLQYVIREADRALYTAKESGRDQVVPASL